MSSNPAPKSAWYALAVLVATTLFAFVDRQIINLVAPSLQRELGLSDLQLGTLQGLGLSLAASVAAYPIGWLSDRYGRRLVLGSCILVWSLSTAACAFQTSFAGLFAATAGIAIGEAALAPVIFSMLPDLFPERQRNSANFIFFGATLLGVAIGLGLGGTTLSWLDTHHDALPQLLVGLDSWRVALILVASPGPAFVALLATIRIRTHSGHAIAGTGADADEVLPFIRAHWRAFACIYGAIFFYTLPLNAAFSWLPVALPRIFTGMEAASIGMQMGIAVGVGSIVGLVLPAACTAILRGNSAVRPIVLARAFMIAASVPTLFLPMAAAPWHVYAVIGTQLAFMLATGALMPGVLQLLSPPRLRSRLISVLGICTGVATGLAPMFVGALSGLLDPRNGLLTAMVIVGLPGWLAAALLISLARRPFLATIAIVGANDETAARQG